MHFIAGSKSLTRATEGTGRENPAKTKNKQHFIELPHMDSYDPEKSVYWLFVMPRSRFTILT